MIISLLLLSGIVFLLAGTLGLNRLPDVYNRIHAIAKSSTLGVAGIVLASFLHLGMTTGVYNGKIFLTILFVFLTAPVGAQMICRAAYQIGVQLWDQSVLDELQHRFTQPERVREEQDF